MGTHVREQESHVLSRRRALYLGAAVLMVPAGVVALAAMPDPIFTCIAEHRRLMEPVRACNTEIDGEERLSELLHIADTQFAELLTTVPTTLPGVFAWVNHIRHYADRSGLANYETPDGVNEEELFLDTLTSALARLSKGIRS